MLGNRTCDVLYSLEKLIIGMLSLHFLRKIVVFSSVVIENKNFFKKAEDFCLADVFVFGLIT